MMKLCLRNYYPGYFAIGTKFAEMLQFGQILLSHTEIQDTEHIIVTRVANAVICNLTLALEGSGEQNFVCVQTWFYALSKMNQGIVNVPE